MSTSLATNTAAHRRTKVIEVRRRRTVVVEVTTKMEEGATTKATDKIKASMVSIHPINYTIVTDGDHHSIPLSSHEILKRMCGGTSLHKQTRFTHSPTSLSI